MWLVRPLSVSRKRCNGARLPAMQETSIRRCMEKDRVLSFWHARVRTTVVDRQRLLVEHDERNATSIILTCCILCCSCIMFFPDALKTEGFEAAIERCLAFRDAGCDMTFLEAPV